MIKLIQTYIFTDHGDYFVSTMNRESSACLPDPIIYAETIVWEWDRKARKRKHIVGGESANKDDISVHQEVVNGLYNDTEPIKCPYCMREKFNKEKDL